MAREKSSNERKPFGIRIKPELMKKLRMLAVEKDMQVNHLLEEAIEDLLEKYKEDWSYLQLVNVSPY